MAQSHEDEWESHRRELKHLWLDRDWTAKQVQNYMSQSYSFYRSEDWQFVSARQEKRKRDGKDPGWVYNLKRGKRVPDSKVRKEIARHVPLSSKYSEIETSDPKTPEGILVCTPGAQPHDIGTEPDSQEILPLNDWSQPPNFELSNWVIPEALQLSGGPSPPPIILSDPSSLDFILQGNREPAADAFNPNGDIFECDLPISFKSFDGSDGPSFFSKLEPITSENFNLGCTGKAKASVQSPLRDKLFDYLNYCIYLSSNNHLDERSTAKLVSLISKFRAFSLLRTLLKFNDTAVEIFMGNLLRSAAGLGEVEICEILIQAGADLDCFTGDFMPRTALHQALQGKNNACAKLLLAAGAEPNLPVNKQTPLQYACSVRSVNPFEAVSLLRSFGAAVNPPFNSSRLSPLQLAIRAEDTELARYLLKEGADPNFFANSKSGTPLQLASAFSGNSGMAELLLEAGANINSRSGYQKSDPHAVGTEDSEIGSDSDSDLDSEFDLDFYCCSDDGAISLSESLSFSFMPPILIAAIRENWEVVQLLLDEGVKVNPSWRTCKTELLESEMSSYTTPVFTPLQAAVLAKNITMTRMILTHEAHIDARPKGNQGHTALQIAVMVMSERLVELLLAKGADVNAPAGILYGKTALQAAAKHSDTKILRILLKNGAHVNAPPSERNGKTALQFAIAAGNIEGVEILLDSQAAVNTDPCVTGGVTALKEAAQLRDPVVKNEILHLLMRAGVDTEVPADQSRNAPLHSFVECGDLETTRKLLEKGVSPNPGYSAKSYLTPLQEASAWGEDSLVELLIKHGADINAPAGSYGGRTALQAAAERNRQSVVDLLLESGADIKSEAASYRGISAIEAAVLTANEKLVRMLLAKCPDAIVSNQKARHQVLALALRNITVDVSLLELLLKAGAFAGNNEVSTKESSIMQAATCRGFDVFRCILTACANLNQRWIRDSPSDVTAIQAAASRNNIDVVRALLEKGADANAPANKLGGMTALQTAVSRNNFEMVELLIQHGADVNGLPSPARGRTALQAAAEDGFVKLTEYLIARGANVNAPAAHDRGVTALQGAAIKGNIRIVEILLRCGAEINGAPAIEQGRSAIEGAAENGRLHTLRLLLDKHPNTEEFDIRRKRASRFAQANGQVAIERFLLAYRKQPRV
ncbi:ankyrin repeat-containing domain protein [Penicillium cosmopolitanum]|uniref:Ankyrin repeat-containing domain protein n=1 Tax=Penicillium cosmopolitanum TaxID=1131564 RepID=A0A9W9W8I1_9EURO|nr:ankyrin repeat-containing domain protein [Penicillium cosmopolitanum]KAJ5408380.1 ankyrin repeat-containing domain protein [Penicillium cosmopolitanum]